MTVRKSECSSLAVVPFGQIGQFNVIQTRFTSIVLLRIDVRATAYLLCGACLPKTRVRYAVTRLQFNSLYVGSADSVIRNMKQHTTVIRYLRNDGERCCVITRIA